MAVELEKRTLIEQRHILHEPIKVNMATVADW